MELCELDDEEYMKDLKTEALKFLEKESKRVSPDVQDDAFAKLEVVARQLVATLFYFELQGLQEHSKTEFLCLGLIRCRLSRSCSTQFRSLTQINPVFRVCEGSSHDYVPVTLESPGWDPRTFSVKAMFRISKSSAEVRVEVS